jgi:hypothetical protein
MMRLRVYEVIEAMRTATAGEIGRRLGLSREQVCAALYALKRQGSVVCEIRGPASQWRITRRAKPPEDRRGKSAGSAAARKLGPHYRNPAKIQERTQQQATPSAGNEIWHLWGKPNGEVDDYCVD